MSAQLYDHSRPSVLGMLAHFVFGFLDPLSQVDEQHSLAIFTCLGQAYRR
jgi:hypothetical protein